jgi:hypothetical protein
MIEVTTTTKVTPASCRANGAPSPWFMEKARQ